MKTSIYSGFSMAMLNNQMVMTVEAQRQNAGICKTCEKRWLIWTFISIGRRVTQEQTIAFRLRGDAIFVFKGEQKDIRF